MTPEEPDPRALKDLTTEEVQDLMCADAGRVLAEQAANRAAAGTDVAPFGRNWPGDGDAA